MDAVDRYFSRQASVYEDLGQQPIWRFVRGLEAKSIFSLLGDITGKSCLEIGCGAGYYSKLMINNGAGNVTAVDRNANMLDQLDHPKIRKVIGDACDFKDEGFYDVVLLAGVLEFIENPKDALTKAHSLCRYGSRLVALVPNRTAITMLYQQFHKFHDIEISTFLKSEIAMLMEDTGWKTEHFRTCLPFSLTVSAGWHG